MKQGVRPLAHQRGFEPPTYRLGGGRSILLSYWCIQHIFYPNILYLSRKSGTFFTYNRIYCPVVNFWKGETDMYLRFDPMADLDDLIFDEDAGGPSER